MPPKIKSVRRVRSKKLKELKEQYKKKIKLENTCSDDSDYSLENHGSYPDDPNLSIRNIEKNKVCIVSHISLERFPPVWIECWLYYFGTIELDISVDYENI